MDFTGAHLSAAMSGSFGNIPDFTGLGATSNTHRQSVDSVQVPFADEVTDCTLIFDMRAQSNTYIKGDSIARQGLETNSNRFMKYLEETFRISSSNILMTEFQNETVAILVSEEQLQETQVVFMDSIDKYPFCISMKNNENISNLFGVHFDETGRRVDAVYIQGGEETPCSVLKTGDFGELATQSGRNYLFLDERLKLGIRRHLEENREETLYIECNKSDTISVIRTKLKAEFSSLFQRDTTLLFCDRHGIVEDTTMIGNTDGRHIFKERCDPEQYMLTLFTARSDTKQVKFVNSFNGRQMITIIQKNDTIAELRNSISKIIHHPAAGVKLTICEEELLDARKVSELLTVRPKAIICAEMTTPQKLTFIRCRDGRTDEYKLTAFRLDPLGGLHRKLAYEMEADPFTLQLYRNGSVLDGNITIGSMGLGSSEQIEVVVHTHRIRVFVTCSETLVKRIIVDDSSTFTVLQLQQFLSILFNRKLEATSVLYNGTTPDSSLTLNEAGLTHGCTLSLTFLSEDDTVPNRGPTANTLAFEREIGPMDVTDESQAMPGDVMQSRVSRAMNTRTRIHGIREEKTLAGKAQNSLERVVTSRPVNVPEHMTAPATDVIVPVETSVTFSTSANPWQFPRPQNANQQVSNTEIPLVPRTTVPIETDGGDNGGQRGYYRITSVREYWPPQSSNLPSSPPIFHRSFSDNTLACIPGTLSSSSSLPSLLRDPENAVPDCILSDLAWRLGNDWYIFGIGLGLTTCHLDAIKNNLKDNLWHQAYQMLVRWKVANGRQATLETLCTRLRECELAAHADSIEELIKRYVSNQ